MINIQGVILLIAKMENPQGQIWVEILQNLRVNV